MANFRFQGRSDQGQLVEGTMEATSQDAVASLLLGQGVTPTKIIELDAAQSVLNELFKKLKREKIKDVDKIMFCRQMYTITKSGIPLVRGIRGLAASIRHAYFREVLNDVASRLESGTTLSQSLAHHPSVFDNLFLSMISVGETSGSLDIVFQQLAFYIERDEETRKSIKSAMRYPSFVLIAIALAIAIVNVVVIPKFAEVFEQFGSELPLVTKILIGTSDLFINYWWAIIIALFGSTVGIITYLRSAQGALKWGEYKLKIPVVGDIISRASMARYSRSFALMMKAGVPLNQSLALCARAIDNDFLELKIDKIRAGVERGESLLRTHQNSGMFSPLVLQMVAVGEESGQIEELLAEVAGFYEREVDYDIKSLSAKIEPILIVVMAVFVTILALGIFLPMWSLYEVQSGKG